MRYFWSWQDCCGRRQRHGNHSLTIFGASFEAVWKRTARNNKGSHAPFRPLSLDSFQCLHVASAASALVKVSRRYSGGRLKTRCSKRYFLMPRWIGWQVEQANNGDTLRHGLTAETNRHPWLSSPFHYERSGLRCGCPVARDWSTRRTVN